MCRGEEVVDGKMGWYEGTDVVNPDRGTRRPSAS